MKTFEEFIIEKWVSDIPKRKQIFPIYENPSSKDLVDLKKAGLIDDHIRFAAIAATKKLYVWSGLDVVHDDALIKLIKDKIITRNLNHNNIEQAFCGECKIISGRLSFAKNNGMDSYFAPLISGAKKAGRNADVDSFLLEPYYDFKDLIDDLPEIINRYKWVSKFIDEYETQSSPAILLNIVNKT